MTKERIFIVEDEALIAMELKDRLERHGYAVAGTASRGEDAVARIEAAPPPDLILMDMKLAGELDGVETAGRIRERRDIPVIFLTAYADDLLLERAKQISPFGYLVKPFDDRTLHSTIEMALHRIGLERQVRESELRFRSLVATVPGAVYTFRVDPAGLRSVPFISDGIIPMIGMTPAEIMADVEAAFHRVPAEERAGMEESIDASRQALSPWLHEFPFLTATGERKWIRGNSLPQREPDGSTVWNGVFVDITEHKLAEESLIRLNRALRTLSRCNEKLVHAQHEEELLHDICSVIVTETGYRMAWVGYAEHDEAKTVRPVRWRGFEDDYLNTVKISWADNEYGRGPTGTAIRTGRHLVVQNVQTDPRFALWKEEAAKRGYESIIGLPLKTGDTVLGALTIYDMEPDAFDDDEVKLLTELAEDIAFGIAAIRERAAREKAETQVQRNYDTQRVIAELLNFSLTEVTLQAVFQRALDLILSIPWLSFESKGGIFRSTGEGGELLLLAEKNMEAFRRERCSVVPQGRCLCGRAAATKKLVFADRIDERHEIRHQGDTPHGHYCVPILQGGALLGVINIYVREGHVRTAMEEEFLATVANALAGIIQRQEAEDDRELLVNDLRKTVALVSHSQKEWQQTFDGIGDMISIHDTQCTVIRANRAFAAFLGKQPQEVVNRKCHEIMHGTCHPLTGCPHVRTLGDGNTHTEEVHDPKSGKTLQVSTFPWYDNAGAVAGSIHIAKDITGEKDREMRLILAERLASLGQMASGIAHEINNPLAAISGCTEGLLGRIGQDRYDAEFFVRYLNIIGEEVSRCKNITTNMLSFVRMASPDRKPLDLPGLMDKTLAIIGIQGRLKKVDVIKSYQDPMPAVPGSEGEVRQFLLAMVTNAVDAMKDKGVLTIGIMADGGRAKISIADSGAGILPENLSRIFDPFFTTKTESGGTGLGLSIAKKIIANHNGTIDVLSAPEKGTTFTITLPLS
ncbi:MAG: GAF domain-containing protein [Nitrospirota bacterium]|nr:GAF domain-containing protein [Nitrospirota bacterium]